jgi:hypothetical protein
MSNQRVTEKYRVVTGKRKVKGEDLKCRLESDRET